MKHIERSIMIAEAYEQQVLQSVTQLYVRRLNATVKKEKELEYKRFKVRLNPTDTFLIYTRELDDDKTSVNINIWHGDKLKSTIMWDVWKKHLASEITVVHDKLIDNAELEYMNSVLLAGIYEFLQ